MEGNFEALQDAYAEKAKLSNELPSLETSSSEKTIKDLKSRMAINQNLLQAALSGLKAAKVRLEDISSAQTELHVYNDDGRLSNVRTTPSISIKS